MLIEIGQGGPKTFASQTGHAKDLVRVHPVRDPRVLCTQKFQMFKFVVIKGKAQAVFNAGFRQGFV